MSPEQARGGTIDGRSDLFSVGCILYEMLAGQKAFRGESITALLFKIITEEPPSLRELDPTVSDEMLRIIGKALSKAPETRYQSGRELADDLLALTRPGFVPTLRAAETPTLPPGHAARRRAHDRLAADGPARGHHRLGRDRGPAGRRRRRRSRPRGAAAAAPDDPDPADRARGAAARSPRSPRLPLAPRSRSCPGPPARKGGGAGLIVGLGLAGGPRARGDRGRRLVPLRPQGDGAAADALRRLGPGDRGSRDASPAHRDAAGGDASRRRPSRACEAP